MLASYLGFMDQYHPGHKQGKRQQPTHPSMISPNLTSDNNIAGGRWPHPRRGPQDQRVPHLNQSVYRDAPNRMTTSMMMRSSLLDHHHQPTSTGLGARSTRFHPPNMDKPLKEEDSEEASSQGGIQGYRGQLGESFVSQGVETTEDAFDDGVESAGASAGVLGLLNQFVAAHGEGGGTRAAVAII